MTTRYVVRAFYPKNPELGIRKAFSRTIGFLEVEERGSSFARIKLDMVPIGPGWNGWCNCYPEGEDDKLPKRHADPDPGNATFFDRDDDVPF